MVVVARPTAFVNAHMLEIGGCSFTGYPSEIHI